MATLPQTEKRVQEHTAEYINRRIRRELEANVHFYAEHSELIDDRLSELDAEWNIERVLETNASALSLFGILMAKRNCKWLVLPFAISAFLLQHAIQGWCPPLEVLRRIGIRTAKEIHQERQALRVLRGDFDKIDVSAVKEAKTKARKALEAIED